MLHGLNSNKKDSVTASTTTNLQPDVTLLETGIGGDHAPHAPQPFATALSQTYGATDQAIRPLQVGVTTTTVVQQAQAGLRQGFQWLGEIVHRTMGNVFQTDPLLAVTFALSGVPTRSD